MNGKITIRNADAFKKAYSKCQTYGDWDKLLAKTATEILDKVGNTLRDYVDFIGDLDLRDNVFLSNLRRELIARKEQTESHLERCLKLREAEVKSD